MRLRELQAGRSQGGNSGRYRITTPNDVVTANRLVIGVDADAFKKIGGDIAVKDSGAAAVPMT